MKRVKMVERVELPDRLVSVFDGREYRRRHNSFSRHLKKFGITIRDYIETYVTGVVPICEMCHRRPRIFDHKAGAVYFQTCGKRECVRACQSKIKMEWSDERKAEVGDRISRGHAKITTHLSAVRRNGMNRIDPNGKTRAQNLVGKIRATKAARYGDMNYNNPEQISASKLSHSVERRNEINELRRTTLMEKYGVPNIFMLDSVRFRVLKGNSRRKLYNLPSGISIMVRGYEPWALDELLQIHEEGDLTIDGIREHSESMMQSFRYVRTDRVHSLYVPDVLIVPEQKYIEIKSWFWFNEDKRERTNRLENNIRKQQAVIDAGFQHEFWVYRSKYEKEVIRDARNYQR